MLTIKLSVIEVSPTQFVTRLESTKLGATGGHLAVLPFGVTGDWLEDFLDKWIDNEVFEKLSDNELRDFGKALYDTCFGAELQGLLSKAELIAADRIDLAIAVHGKRLYEIPFELLHDGQRYLRQRLHIVRIIDDGSNSGIFVRPIRKLLIVLAQPMGEPNWGGLPQYRADLEKLLAPNTDLKTEFIDNPTPNELREELRKRSASGELIDALYILAHGKADGVNDSHLSLRPDHLGNETLTGADLAERLREHPGCFVFVNACNSGVALEANPYSGIAQQLLTAGRASAVVGMQRPIPPERAMAFAERFFTDIARKDVEDAIQFALEGFNNRYRSVPCFYTRIANTEDRETAKLRSLLNVDPDTSRLSVYLPRFRMGLLKQEYETNAPNGVPKAEKGQFNYKGETIAWKDMRAVRAFVSLFRRAMGTLRDDIVVFKDAAELGVLDKSSHLLLLGSGSQVKVHTLLKKRSADFDLVYGDDTWTIKDKVLDREYTVPNPSKYEAGRKGDEAAAAADDYALIEKIIHDSCVIFVFAGLQDTGTAIAGEYVEKNWQNLYEKYGGHPFQILLELGGGLGNLGTERIDRETPSQADRTAGTL